MNIGRGAKRKAMNVRLPPPHTHTQERVSLRGCFNCPLQGVLDRATIGESGCANGAEASCVCVVLVCVCERSGQRGVCRICVESRE